MGAPYNAVGLGGQIAISINGEVGHFFHNKQGLRQGDPFSLILFNFVVYAFAVMFDEAKVVGHLKGVVSHLIPAGLSQLWYTNNNMLLFQPDIHNIATVKLIL